MGYINHSFFIRIAVLGGMLSLLPLPVLAKVLIDESDSNDLTVETAQVIPISDDGVDNLQHSDLTTLSSLDTSSSSDDPFLPAVMESMTALSFATAEPNLHQPMALPVKLNQLSQLPNLPDDELNGSETEVNPNVPTDGENVQTPPESLDSDGNNELPEKTPVKVAPIPAVSPVTGEIVPDTGQAESTSIEDLLDTSNLPPSNLLADPNPLSVPTLESEIFLQEGDERTISLSEAIELAYFNNQDLQVALLELEQAEAALTQARSAFYPSASVSANLTRTTTPGPFGRDNGNGTDTDTTLSINPLRAEYDIFTSGQRVASVRAAKEQVHLSELELERRREELRLETTTLYYDLQESGEQIRINKSFVDEAQRNQRDNELRRQAGVGTRFDVLRADVQLANAQQDLIQSQSQQRIARRNLARLLNVPSTVNLNATPVPAPANWEDTYERWTLTLEDSILLAWQSRVELDQQLAQREIGLQQSRAFRAANGPQVSLFAQYLSSDLLDDDFDIIDTDQYQVGLAFSMVLADGGSARAQARQQELNAEIAEERFSEALDQIRFDVEQSYFTLRSNEENVRTARTAVTQAATALELANLRLDAGVGTQLDVLTAQSELTQAEGNWVTAALGYNRALASLQRAVSNLRSTL